MPDEQPEDRYKLTIKQAASQEGNKLIYDAYKHLTTLNTGSIVLIATFSERIFKEATWKPLVGVALVMFVLSMITAFLSMGIVAQKIHDAGSAEGDEFVWEAFLGLTALPALICFLLGLVAFAIFSLRNLMT